MKKRYAVFALCTIACDAFGGYVELSGGEVKSISYNGDDDYYELAMADGRIVNAAECLHDQDLADDILDAISTQRDYDGEFNRKVSAALQAA